MGTRAESCGYLQREGLAVIEFNQQHGLRIMATHRLDLVVQPAAVEGADQIAETLALDANVRRQNVVANFDRDRQYVDAATVQQ